MFVLRSFSITIHDDGIDIHVNMEFPKKTSAKELPHFHSRVCTGSGVLSRKKLKGQSINQY